MAGEQNRTKWTIPRRASAVLLLGGLLWATAQSATGRRFQRCTEQLAGDAEIVEVCRPIDSTDPAFLVGLVLALMPLAPDVQRLQVGSLLTIERRLKATEASQEALRTQLEAIVVRQDVRQEQRQYFYVGEPSATRLVEVVAPEDELRRKEQEFRESLEEKDGD